MLSDYTEIFVRIRHLGPTFADEFGESHDRVTKYVTDFMNETRLWKESIKLQKLQDKEQNDQRLKSETQDRVLNEKFTLCKNIFENICLRIRKLDDKCSKVSELSDSQVLDARKKVHDLDADFNDILDRVTKIYEVRSTECEKTDELILEVSQKVEKLASSVDYYKNELETAVITRDISQEKLKNASQLGIKLEPFKGYESRIDYYTFKSEFEKLIAPHVHAPLLPDHLKKNYLGGQARELVKEINNLDSIWDRLKQSYGNVENLMSKKLGEFDKGVPLGKAKGDEKVAQAITRTKNIMTDLKTLSEKHNIEQSLYHSSNISRILGGFGRKRQTHLTKVFVEGNLTEKEKWAEMIRYLEKELKITEQLVLLDKSNDQQSTKKSSDSSSGRENSVLNSQEQNTDKKCFVCDRTDHVPFITNYGKSIINYISCKKFVDMTPKQRYEFLKRNFFCFQCLGPGRKKGHEGRCFDKYKCPHNDHTGARGIHVLICDAHKEDDENKRLFELYKEKCITNTNIYPDYSLRITLHTEDMSYTVEPGTPSSDDDTEVRGMYMLQTIKLFGRKVNLFYDNGCGDMVIKKCLLDFLKKHNRILMKESEPKFLSGVGDVKSVCPHGKFEISIPTDDGPDAVMDGICLDKITSKFPTIPLDEIEKDIQDGFVESGGEIDDLPKLTKSVGGETELMVGLNF